MITVLRFRVDTLGRILKSLPQLWPTRHHVPATWQHSCAFSPTSQPLHRLSRHKLRILVLCRQRLHFVARLTCTSLSSLEYQGMD